MDARPFSLLDEFEEPAPATQRAPVTHLSRLVVQTIPPAERDAATPFAGKPSVDLVARALGIEEDVLAMMRNLYLQGDTDSALSLAARIHVDDDDAIEELSADDVILEDDDLDVDGAWD